MYCYINPNLFKKFQSMGKKIIPQFSDDWKIIFESYRTIKGVKLHSDKLNQTIADIPINELFHMLKHYKANLIHGEKIEGEFIVGADRKLYSREDYNEWHKKYGNLIQGKVLAKDLILGRKYKFKCGAEGYLVAIDRDEKNKPIYVFGNKESKIVRSFYYKNLKNVSEMIDETVPDKMAKFIMCDYLKNPTVKKSISKIIKTILVYQNGKIIDENYIEKGYDARIYKKSYDAICLNNLSSIALKDAEEKYAKEKGYVTNLDVEIEDDKITYSAKVIARNKYERKETIIQDVVTRNIYIDTIDEDRINELPNNVKIYKI